MAKFSPMMEQYFNIKNNYKDCLLLFRLGDFYELFFDDALLASKELGIALTGRDCGQEERAPMCGVPFHSAETYIAKLVEAGHKVAVCEQTGDLKASKTIVKREVVRVITPGTMITDQMLGDGKNNYIACIYTDGKSTGLSYCDISTGFFTVTGTDSDDSKKIIDELARISPAEIITNNEKNNELIKKVFNIQPNIYYSWAFEKENASKQLCEHFRVHNLNGYGIQDDNKLIRAAGALLAYLYETQKNSLKQITTLKQYKRDSYMTIDIASRRNLELTETIRGKEKKGTLLWVLDSTKTPMGARLLRNRIENPITDIKNIEHRLDAVEEFVQEGLLREKLRSSLKEIHDIERLMSKIIYETITPKDMLTLKASMRPLKQIKELISSCKTKLISEMHNSFDTLEDMADLIESTIEEEIISRDSGYIRQGINKELDYYRNAKDNGDRWLSEYEEKEKANTGIKNLKIKFNKVFGYFIELTNSQSSQAPDYFIRRQTLSNCERYTTEELKEIEEAILSPEEKAQELEQKIFKQLRDNLSKEIERIQLSSYIIGVLDVLLCFAYTADKNRYVKPRINNEGIIYLKDGRHPVVEQIIDLGFVENDVYLDNKENRLSIITGPNMAGKSTYMRQVALSVIMAQMGCFVPASEANISVVDRVFTRVGASDDLATGQSTFMVEMTEIANILNNATKNSLLILDEVGRGTSTYDGLSIAWSVLEYISGKIGAKTLFATHYFELTELEGKLDGVINYCISATEQGEDLVFLRKLLRGAADRSYGIQVAKFAGIPNKVIARAKSLLTVLNSADITKKDVIKAEIKNPTPQVNKPTPESLCLKELLGIDTDSLTPREALAKLYELQQKYSGNGGSK